MTTTTVNVADMHCASCSSKIVQALSRQSGINKISVNPLQRRLFISHDPSLSAVSIIDDIQGLGFTPSVDDVFNPGDDNDRHMLRRLGVAGICGMQVMMIHIALYAGYFQGMDGAIEQLLKFAGLVFCIPIVAYAAMPFFQHGLVPMMTRPHWRSINMDTPIALAIGMAFCVSLLATLNNHGEVYFDSVAMFTFLMLGARYLDQRLRSKFKVEETLTASLPKTVTRLDAGERQTQIPLENAQIGDRLWIAEGEQIPADGTLLSPSAHIDNSLLTGENTPAHHDQGATLFAGTINAGTAFALSVTQLKTDTRIAAIDQIAQTAAHDKHALSSIADRVAQIFLPCILLIALATYVYWSLAGSGTALSAVLAVLVVSCPCALSLAAPAAINAALTNLRRHGLLVRHARAIERAGFLQTAIFDKTGTLTQPKPELVTTRMFGHHSEQRCLELAAALERHVSHPLATLFRPHDTQLTTEGITVAHGAGISGTVDGHNVVIGNAAHCGCPDQTELDAQGQTVYLQVDGQLAAVFVVDRALRADAPAAIDQLKASGLDVLLLSGDKAGGCAEIAAQLKVPFHAGATPEDKQAFIAAQDGILYIGDGLNDLPALASADVSVSTLETIDLVKARADVLLMSERLGDIPRLVAISRRCRKIMQQNMAWALAYNVVAIPLAASGIAAPWLAALGMSVSSLLVLTNSTRLLRA